METTTLVPEIQFEELLKLVSEEDNKEEVDSCLLFLIDVREESELNESGWIPTAINIPIGEFENALDLPSNDFQRKYKRDKPNKQSGPPPELVVYCRSGRRAIMAHQIFTKLGYQKTRCYKGSFLEWQSKGGPIITK